MKSFIALFLFLGISHAQTPETPEDIEVGSQRDCIFVGKTDDQDMALELNQIQQKITDCLAPQEEEAQAQVEKSPEVVSQ